MNLLKILLSFIIALSVNSFEITTDQLPLKFTGTSWTDILKYVLELGKYYMPKTEPGENPYYNCFPKYMNHIKPGQEKFKFTGKCFQEIEVEAILNDDQSVTLNVDNQKPVSWTCTETLLISTFAAIHFEVYFFSGKSTLQFKFPQEEALQYDLHQQGIRIFRFHSNADEIITNVIKTAELFAGFLLQEVPDYYAQQNLNFLKTYAGIDMKPRQIINVPIDESLIRSGDSFTILRLDGIDPMIAWAMGSSNGHHVVAVKRDGRMQVCESQSKGSYWPINGIQCNDYKDWIQMATDAQYQYLWLPIDRSIEFDEEKANEFIDTLIGVDYGFPVLLTGWLDTIRQNLPCQRDINEGVCLEAEVIEILFTTLERLVPDAAIIWKQAMNHRVNLTDAPLYEVYHQAWKNGINSTELFTIPENDEWLYNTTRYDQNAISKVMICHEFVCQVFRAGGVFGDLDFNCNEFSLYDTYKLDIYQKDFQRPQQCIDADPENPLCQLGGKYTLRLDLGNRQGDKFNFVKPYNNMGEKCPSLAPNYVCEDQC